MRPFLCAMFLLATPAFAGAPSASGTPTTELGCVTFELRAATFRAIEAETLPTFRQAMHHCVVTVGSGKQAPRRT